MMNRQLSQQSSGTMSSPLAPGDSYTKLRLMEYYLTSEFGGLLTPKDLQDWATAHGYDKNKVKQLN